jgi:hypothetical protein
MEIKPTGKPAAPEPAEAPTAPAPAGPAKAKAHVAAAQDHLEVYVPPKLDLGHGGMARLPDPSDMGNIPRDLGSELPADFGTGPAEHHPSTPNPRIPDPPPPPPEDFVSRFRDPVTNPAAFSPEIGGTEKGPDGNPKKPAIRHGIGPGHFTTPVPGPKGPIGPDGFDKPGMPRPPDPRTSAPVEPPGPQPAPTDPPDPPPPDSLAFPGLIAERFGATASSPVPRPEPAPAPTDPPDPPDPPDNVGFSATIAQRLHTAVSRSGEAMQGETFGVQDPGPPTGPIGPPPKPDSKPIG